MIVKIKAPRHIIVKKESSLLVSVAFWVTFILGFLFGISFSWILVLTFRRSVQNTRLKELEGKGSLPSTKSNLLTKPAEEEKDQATYELFVDLYKPSKRIGSGIYHELFCWVTTMPEKDLNTNAIADTWAKRCGRFIFVSNFENATNQSTGSGRWYVKRGQETAKEPRDRFDTLFVDFLGRKSLWGKTMTALNYIYKEHFSDFSWFLKADDDSFVIVENLRLLLGRHWPQEPIYFGKKFWRYIKQGYMSGGAGYILSRESLRRLIEIGFSDSYKIVCKLYSIKGSEDAELGQCLNKVGVVAGDSRDNFGRGRFSPFRPEVAISTHVPSWYWNYVKVRKGSLNHHNCCSSIPISFHYLKPPNIYEMEYLLYRVRIEGYQQPFPFQASLPAAPESRDASEVFSDEAKRVIWRDGGGDFIDIA